VCGKEVKSHELNAFSGYEAFFKNARTASVGVHLYSGSVYKQRVK
jgi:hypothetical protein